MNNVEKLAAQIRDLLPAEKLRLAADIVDRGSRYDTAEAIVELALVDIAELRLLNPPKGKAL